MEPLSPYESAKFVNSESKHVKVDQDGTTNLADVVFKAYSANKYSLKSWKQHLLHPKEMNSTAIDWIFFVDTLNFSFWSEDQNNRIKVEWNGETYSGYFSLCAAVNRAISENVPLIDAKFYKDLQLNDMKHYCRTKDGREIPLLEERVRVIKEAGEILMTKFNGSFLNCVKECGKSAQTLLKLIVDNFPSYRDEATYNGKQVSLYKRAQILISDIWACFEGQGFGEFTDIESITMFADYRIPQVLNHFGALKYSNELQDKLNKNHMFESGDPIEVEIRACSIWCIEIMKQEIDRKFSLLKTPLPIPINSILIDNFLWDYRRDHDEEIKRTQFHKIRCIYY